MRGSSGREKLVHLLKKGKEVNWQVERMGTRTPSPTKGGPAEGKFCDGEDHFVKR